MHVYVCTCTCIHLYYIQAKPGLYQGAVNGGVNVTLQEYSQVTSRVDL